MLIRHLASIIVVACLQLAQAQAQAPVPILAPSSKVVTDSKGNPKVIHVEFQIRSEDVVQHAKLFYRQPGAARYLEQDLKLNRELLYAASIPYAERVEYFISVTPERGADFILGSSANPQLLSSEDLPHVQEVRQGRAKKFAIVATVVVAIVTFFAIGEAIKMGQKKK